MKKKIIAIGIVGMFLLMGLTTVSAVEKKTSLSEKVSDVRLVTKDNEDLPDLTIELYIRTSDVSRLVWKITPLLYNKGTASVPEGTQIVLMEEYQGFDSWHNHSLSEPLEPGDYIQLPQSCNYPKIACAGTELTIVVDPLPGDDYPWPEFNPDPEFGVIKELNEDNNIDALVFPKAKYQYRPLFSLLNRFPMLQEILEKLAFLR